MSARTGITALWAAGMCAVAVSGFLPAAGVADTASGEPARPDHRFRIASNTKSFVSTVLLQLEGEGRLSPDEGPMKAQVAALCD
ncbi:serine hydrolase [Kitasatospora aburaviensis]|uniref:Serine hydrolase n=1 Tax=Kitasatospora aburaviensis TaxID=67265 RepID=A0ABW1F049_9ACTN